MNELDITKFIKDNNLGSHDFEIKGNKIRCCRYLVDRFTNFLDSYHYIYQVTYKFGEWSEVVVTGYRVVKPIPLVIPKESAGKNNE